MKKWLPIDIFKLQVATLRGRDDSPSGLPPAVCRRYLFWLHLGEDRRCALKFLV